MRFKQFYNKDIDTLMEGGNAIKHVVPIEQVYVKDTLKNIEKILLSKMGLHKRGIDWEVLGSVGKKKTASGDIDLAINTLSLLKNKEIKTTKDILPFLEKIVKNNKLEYVVSSGIGVISMSFPISGYDGYVQLDLMLTDNMDYTTWAYWSPSESESRFKKMGFYRNLLMSTILSEIQKKVLKTTPKGETEEVEKLFWDLSKGVGKKITSFKGKTGSLVKGGTVVKRENITLVPDEILKIMFGPNATRNDANSFETLWKKVISPDFQYKDKINDIKKSAKETFIKQGLPVPTELE
jgi:hypothetical protein